MFGSHLEQDPVVPSSGTRLKIESRGSVRTDQDPKSFRTTFGRILCVKEPEPGVRDPEPNSSRTTESFTSLIQSPSSATDGPPV